MEIDGEDDVYHDGDFFVGPSNIGQSRAPERPCHRSRALSTQSSDSSYSELTPLSRSEASSPSPEAQSLSDLSQDQVDVSRYVALGAVRIHEVTHQVSRASMLWTLDPPDSQPGPMIQMAVQKGFLQTEYLQHVTLEGYASLRIYALGEDVSRHGQAQSARSVIKKVMEFLDVSHEAWSAQYDPKTPAKEYCGVVDESDSLFYIFNTLRSPNPCWTDPGDPYARQAVHDVLNGNIYGLQTTLYPYQQRSAAMMVRREAHPSKCLDPRKTELRDCLGHPFYCDLRAGAVLKHPHLYDEARGGILAETMGYGKTLICLAVILATRGHLPGVPDNRSEVMPEPRPKIGSLLEMSAACAARGAVPLKAEFSWRRQNGDHHDRIVEELQKYVRKYDEQIFRPQNPSRTGKRTPTKEVRLSAATLVIVPPNLLVQWQHEIRQHCSNDALDLLVIDHSTKEIPPWTELIKLDVVLITKSRFEQEYRDNDLHMGKIALGEEPFQSPLTDVRWLRVICDEGHGFAGSATRTNALAMLDKMFIERRWMVSGTPSNTMLGVEVDLAAHETTNTKGHGVSQTLENRRTPDNFEQEIKDLQKLRSIVVKYLKLQPWANSRSADHADWNRYLIPQNFSERRQNAAVLRTLLQSLIVRHRIEDIAVDLRLPELHNKVVYLELSYYDKLSINLFILALNSNAITSERVDEDYMFHPKNRKPLDELIRNLRQSTFHWVGFKEDDVRESVRVARVYLEDHLTTLSGADRALLQETISAGETTLADLGWRAFSSLHEIGVYIEDFPPYAAEAWSMHGTAAQPLLMGTVQARQVQQYITGHAPDLDPSDGLVGEGLRAMQNARRRASQESNHPPKNSSRLSVVEEPKLKDQTSPTRVKADTSTPSRKRPLSGRSSTLDCNSPLVKARITGFSSAKLAYLVDQVLLHQTSEKIIIFYEGNNVAFWIAEALELLSVKFLIYANTLTVARRATYLATFNQNDDFRVLLMDLKQAAHGLHVAAASRVYIVSPIWQPNIESQAIKRAHRIGQTRPVFVETLVLRDTLEDRMLKRRKQMSNLELKRAERSLLDDSTMNEIIKNERFIRLLPGEGEAEAQVAPLSSPQPLFGRGQGEYGVTGAEAGLIIIAGDVAPVKKRKQSEKRAVGFSDPPPC